MEKLINWQLIKEKNIYNNLTQKLENNKKKDENSYTGSRYYLKCQNYELYKKKLKLIKQITKLNSQYQQNYIETIVQMDYLKNIPEKTKIKMMVSFNVLVLYFKEVFEKSIAELFVISAATADLEIEEYIYFVQILDAVSSAIVNKTEDLEVQLEIAKDIIRFIYDTPYQFNNKEIYYRTVSYANKIIDNYIFFPKKK